MTGRNVEIKAHDRDPRATLARALALGAHDCGTVWQRDTYFGVTRGRLKLREQQPGTAELIFYERVDLAAARTSNYLIARVAGAPTLAAALAAEHGIRVVIEKRRRLLLWKSVRIHLDEVRELGSFVELEAVAPPASDLYAEHALVAEMQQALAIGEDSLLAGSYSDELFDSGRCGQPGGTAGSGP